jgi:hypothetical protein
MLPGRHEMINASLAFMNIAGPAGMNAGPGRASIANCSSGLRTITMMGMGRAGINNFWPSPHEYWPGQHKCWLGQHEMNAGPAGMNAGAGPAGTIVRLTKN